MRIALGILLILHGLAHGVGFAATWHLGGTEIASLDHLLGGRVPLDPGGMRIVGLFWLLAGLAVAGSGLAALLDWREWLPLALGTAAASLLLCLLTLPEAVAGALLNVGVMVLLTLALRQGWAWARPV